MRVAAPRHNPASAEGRAILPVGDTGAVRAYVWTVLKRNSLAVTVLVVANLIAALAATAGPSLLGGIVEQLAEDPSALDLTPTVAIFIVILAVQSLAVMAVRLRGATLGERLLADLREDFLLHAVRLPLGVLERTGTGDLLSRVNADIERMARATRLALPQITTAVVWLLALLGGIVFTAPPLALAIGIAVPPVLVAARWYVRRAPKAYHAETAAYAGVVQVFAETAEAGRTVETYRLGSVRAAQLERRTQEWVAWERYTLWLRTVLMPAANVFHILVIGGVVLLGGFLVLRGWLTIGELTTAVMLAKMLIDPVSTILTWFDALQLSQVSLARLVGVQKVTHAENDEASEPLDRDIVADEVTFGYSPDLDVLHRVTLTVPEGGRLMLVGPSGAGKSTLGRLLAGVYAPRSGSITLGGAELSLMPVTRLRSHIMLVNQEHHVFVGTLRDNLILARPDAGDDDVWDALETVSAATWARSLPAGLDTEVGSGGVEVTPAQSQQIALARIVLADPDVVVLDEATSLLDTKAARQSEQTLARALAGRTVISIAHRLHAAKEADTIAVIVDGRIRECGSHDRLVAAGGSYAALWDSWRS